MQDWHDKFDYSRTASLKFQFDISSDIQVYHLVHDLTDVVPRFTSLTSLVLQPGTKLINYSGLLFFLTIRLALSTLRRILKSELASLTIDFRMLMH